MEELKDQVIFGMKFIKFMLILQARESFMEHFELTQHMVKMWDQMEKN